MKSLPNLGQVGLRVYSDHLISGLQMRTWGTREVQELTLSHTACMWQSRDSDLCSPVLWGHIQFWPLCSFQHGRVLFFISLPQFGTYCYSCLNKVPIGLGNGRKCFPTGKAHIRSLLPLASRNQAISKRGQEARPQQHLQQVLIREKILLFS